MNMAKAKLKREENRNPGHIDERGPAENPRRLAISSLLAEIEKDMVSISLTYMYFERSKLSMASYWVSKFSLRSEEAP